jgi:hypothetical protein
MTVWTEIVTADIGGLADDDVQRNRDNAEFLTGLSVSEARFSEAGFNWHLLRFVNDAIPDGPLWVVPHDDENAAFDAAISALKRHGGVAVIVNSGFGSARLQAGQGRCGGRPAMRTSCDPNRNFSPETPLFTQAHLEQLSEGRPIIALHTNSPGFGHGKGDITILDAAAAGKGRIRPRLYGYFGGSGPAVLKDHDSYAIIPFRLPNISVNDATCRMALQSAGVHVWHEPVGKSDGSLSNYITLHRAGTAYVNMESRREADLSLAAERHSLMVAAYLGYCVVSGN